MIASLPRLWSSLLYAACVAVVYKRSFKKERLAAAGLMLGLGTAIDAVTSTGASATLNVVLAAACALVLYCSNKWGIWQRDWIGTINLAVFLLALLDVRFLETRLLCPYVARIFLVALPQFARRPLWLKNKLQPVRSSVGPVYILYIALEGWEILTTTAQPSVLSLCEKSLVFVAMATSAVAGLLFRPDNSALLSFVKDKSTMGSRKSAHRHLMIVSFGAIAILSLCKLIF